MKAAPQSAMRRGLILLAVLILPLAAQAEAPAFRGMPENVSSGKRPDLALEGGGMNERDRGNALRNASGGASTVPEAGLHPFDAHDLDGDGFVSKAEAAGHARLVQDFDRADRSRDGRLSQAEYARYEKWTQSRRTKRAKSK